jgi:hypothetical protein
MIGKFRLASATLAMSAVVLGGGAAAASPNLVKNGGFELTTNGPNYFTGYGYSELEDWTYGAAPYPNAAVYTTSVADTTGACRPGGCFPLFGPGNGYANGFVGSPDGGNFLASDGEAEYDGAFSQTISGLTPGVNYKLTFDWAGAQYLDGDSVGDVGSLTSDWQVSLGTQTFTTPVVSYPVHGFTGWMSQSFIYTASSTSEVLSFFAQGTPNGEPPTALLDGVSLVPEPRAWALMLIGLAGLGAVARRRRAAGPVPASDQSISTARDC